MNGKKIQLKSSSVQYLFKTILKEKTMHLNTLSISCNIHLLVLILTRVTHFYRCFRKQPLTDFVMIFFNEGFEKNTSYMYPKNEKSIF